MYHVVDTDVIRFYRLVWDKNFTNSDSEPVSVITEAMNQELSEMKIAAKAQYDRENFDIRIFFENPNDFDLFILKWS